MVCGVVLPRSSLYAKGSAQFRRTLFKSIKYINLCLLENTKQWVFDIDPRYTICLTSFSKSSNNKEGLKIQGPFNSLSSFKEKNSDVANVFKMDEVFNWNDTVFHFFQKLNLQKFLHNYEISKIRFRYRE